MPIKGEFITSYAPEALGHEAEPVKRDRKIDVLANAEQIGDALKVSMLPVSDLNPYANNPRNNEAAVDAVAASIEQFGFKVPIIIDPDGVIIAGHTRLKAAQRLGIEKVPCVIADDLTPEQAQAFRLADNKVGELADWDDDKLAEEFAALAGVIDLEMFGFRAEDFSSDDELESEFSEGTAPGAKEKKSKIVKCPNCGQEFEV